jgi:hypothetical protein
MIELYYEKVRIMDDPDYNKDRARARYQKGKYFICICGCYVNERNLLHKNTQVHRNALKKIQKDFQNYANN